MDNYQQSSDWTNQLQLLRRIQQGIIDFGYLGEAISSTRTFLTAFQYDSLGGRLEEIENDYRLMCDFLKKGYQDDKRQALYDKLLGKLYVLLRDIEVDFRRVKDPSVISYALEKSITELNVEVIGHKLESFVSNVAMASLDTEEVRETKVKSLYADHHQYIQSLFNSLLFSHQWSHDFAIGMAELLNSPTIDVNDAQLLISATMLGAMFTGDAERVLALLHIYEHAQDARCRQRALVGWVFALHGLNLSMFPQVSEQIETLLSKETVREELLELQIQVVYCRNAKRDNEKLQKDIMPTLLRNQNFEITDLGIKEKEDNPMDDILNPDAADQKMEELEKSIRKMIDLREQGVDIYFGGFSQMKRFSFFYTLCNWFMPFFVDHPQLQHIAQNFLRSNMIKSILGSGLFCDSDKYSFVLGTSSVFHKLPANIKEMLNSGNVAMMGMGAENIDTQDPSYIRRMYLQDLYRFFSLCDAHKIFENPFESWQFLFMANDVFRNQLGGEARHVQKFMLKKKMYSSLSQLFYAYKEPDNTEDMHMEGNLKIRSRKYMEARAIYARLYELVPDDERAMMGYAQACFYVEDYEEAAQLYEQLHQRHPDHHNLALNLAISQINSDNAAEGMKLLYRLDYENEGDINVKRALAWGHLWLNHLEQADALYQEILTHKACNASDYLNAGYCNWFAGRVELGITLMKQSVAASGGLMKNTEDVMRQFEKDRPLIDKYGIGDIEQKMVAELVMA
ncbi:MAG: tetratricopeptide repeat protein [Prevotella sp.]